MSFEQEKMIVGSLPSLYSLQKFEEEAVNALASLQIDDDTISRKAVTGVLDRYMERLCSHINTPNDTESYSYARGLLVGVINNIKQLPPAQSELIEKAAYIRGFEQGRTQGMIDAQGGKK